MSSAGPDWATLEGNFEKNFAALTFVEATKVHTEPKQDYVAAALEAFKTSGEAPLRMDPDSLTSFTQGIAGNTFTAVVDIVERMIYMCPLASTREGNVAYPHERATVGGKSTAPFVHEGGGANPGHEQLAILIEKSGQNRLVGFSVTKKDNGSGWVESLVSRSQNNAIFRKKPQTVHEQMADMMKPPDQKGVPSQVPSEVWAKLIVKSVVVHLPGQAN
jgi:hypothetical protein